AVGLGVVVSLAAIAFVDLVDWLNNVLLVSPRERVQIEEPSWLVPAATIAVPALGGLLVGALIKYFSPEKRPLGPPDVVLSVQLRTPLPSARGGVISTIAAAISLGFGASVGQYGPLVYLGALLASAVQALKLRINNIEAIAAACGVAAAISTAFNAPIAGLVFAHEVILRHYSMQAFAPVTVASATGYVIANVMFDRPALFLVDFAGVQHGHEFALFAGLGILAAGVAVLFMQLVLSSAQLAQQLNINQIFRPAVAGLAVGITALWLPDVLGVGKETLRFATIEGAFEGWELAVLVIAKIALTALCIGFGFAGGVFSPALLIGILLGALFWTVLNATGMVVTSGIVVYAICGMMALTSPVIGAPLTTILIVFELTRNYDLTIAAMVAVVLSNLVAYRIFGRSLFDVQLKKRGVDLSAGRDRARLSAARIADFASSGFPRCTTDEINAHVAERLAQTNWSEAYVADQSGIYLGTWRAQDMMREGKRSVEAIYRPAALVFDETTTIWEAMRALEGFVGDAVPLVEGQSRKLIGAVTEAAVIEAYLEIVQELRREENAAA
ncbi:MAG: chloride channel protein, partial [Hyphomicrobiales bacterium]